MNSTQDARELLQQGASILAPVLRVHGFRFRLIESGFSSGGPFAYGHFRKLRLWNSRRLELHFRYSLGLVRYHIGKMSLAHEDYMRAILRNTRENSYPGFSDNPLDAFETLKKDLSDYCSDFLAGDGRIFRQCVAAHGEYEKLTPFQKMEFDIPKSKRSEG